jgi:hypothetical protein
MSKEKGSSTIVVLAIVMFLSTVFLAMVFFVRTSLFIEMAHKKDTELRKLLIQEAQAVVELLQEDVETRKSDDFSLDVWEYVNSNADVELKDVGSYLNPNWIDPQVFEHINKRLLPPPKRVFKNMGQYGLQALVDYWDEEGIHMDLQKGYEDFFEEDVIEEYMTPYTYFNINLCFQFVTKKVCEIRTGSEIDGENLQKAIDRRLLKQKVILEAHGIKGIENWFVKTPRIDPIMFKKLFPVVNASPVLNVNYAPEEIIRAILTYKPFGVNNPDYRADRIIKQREDDGKKKKGLTEKDLKTIIGKVSDYPGPRVFHYLGVYTNFWEIKVTIGEATLRWILARVPPLKVTDDPYYKLIEEQIRLRPLPEPTPEPEPITEEEDF